MKHIFSPWRMKYISMHKPKMDCIFCTALDQPDSPENLVLWRGQRCFIILNRFPYTSGHVMVVPMEHQPILEDVSPEANAEMMDLLVRVSRLLRKVYSPEGFNIGANIGAAAGAGVAGHVHFHVVPRWGGDTNFMSAVGETRVLPEDLEETYHRLQAAWGEFKP
jgi:ATP adenylyltransferase